MEDKSEYTTFSTMFGLLSKSSRTVIGKTGIAVPVLVLLILSTSCLQDLRNDIDRIGQIVWDPTLGVPVANGVFTFEDFEEELNSGEVVLESETDGQLVLVYEDDSIFSQSAEDVVLIDDETFNTSFSVDAPTLVDLPINGTITYSEDSDFNVETPNGDLLDSAFLKAGTLQIDLNGDFPASGNITLTFESLLDAGSALVRTYDWTYDGVTPVQNFSETIDLTGMFMDLTSGGTTSNQFDFNATITLIYEGEAVTTANSMEMDIGFTNASFISIFGEFNPREITNQTGEFVLDINNEIGGGTYFFEDPKMIFRILNSYGVPIDLEINSIVGSGSGGNVVLTGNIVGTPIRIGFPEIENLGRSVETEIRIDNTNSNLPALIGAQLDRIEYDFSGDINTDGASLPHYVLDSSKLSMAIRFELPLYGRIRNLTLTEQYDFDGSILEDSQDALLRINTENGFPLDADIQVYFFDANQNFLDSLIYDDSRIIESGIVDANGEVTTPTVKSVDIVLSDVRIDIISRATQIQMRTSLSTPDNLTQSVRFFEDDQIRINLFAQTTFNFTF